MNGAGQFAILSTIPLRRWDSNPGVAFARSQPNADVGTPALYAATERGTIAQKRAQFQEIPARPIHDYPDRLDTTNRGCYD